MASAPTVQCLEIVGNPGSYRLLSMPFGDDISAGGSTGAARPFREYKNEIPVAVEDLPMQRATSSGSEARDQEITLRFKDSQERHIFGNAAPLFDGQGKVRGAVAAFVDVTRLKMVEAKLKHEDQLKNEFLAMLGHELRNPLAAVRNAVILI